MSTRLYRFIILFFIFFLSIFCLVLYYRLSDSVHVVITIDDAYSGEQSNLHLPLIRPIYFSSFHSGCGCLSAEFKSSDKWHSSIERKDFTGLPVDAIKIKLAISAQLTFSHATSFSLFDNNKSLVKMYTIRYTAKARSFVLSNYVVDFGNVVKGDSVSHTLHWYFDSGNNRITKVVSDDTDFRCSFANEPVNVPKLNGYYPIGSVHVTGSSLSRRAVYSTIFIEDAKGQVSTFRIQGSFQDAITIIPATSHMPRNSSNGAIYKSNHTIRSYRELMRSVSISNPIPGLDVSCVLSDDKVSCRLVLHVTDLTLIASKGDSLTIVLSVVMDSGDTKQLTLPVEIIPPMSPRK